MGWSYFHLPNVFAGSGSKRGFRVTRTGPCLAYEMCWRSFIPYVLSQNRQRFAAQKEKETRRTKRPSDHSPSTSLYYYPTQTLLNNSNNTTPSFSGASTAYRSAKQLHFYSIQTRLTLSVRHPWDRRHLQ